MGVILEVVSSKHIDGVNRVVKYIEENLKENITLESISSYVKISKYHLNRIFKEVTNNQLMHYVKYRKLTSSINELLYTDLRIVDIAMEYKFEHEQSYIRSFKNTFNISPGTFRKSKPGVEIIDKLNTDFMNR